MNDTKTGDLDALIQEKIDADTDFSATLDSMSEEERETALADKKKEILSDSFFKNQELAENYKTRAEKAEAKIKGFTTSEEEEEEEDEPKDENLTQSDLLAVMKADVHDDDLSEVVDYAKLKGISVKEALETGVVKTLIAQNSEFRKTANATSTEDKRGGSKQLTDEQILQDASAGKIPKPGTPEAEQLFRARRKR